MDVFRRRKRIAQPPSALWRLEVIVSEAVSMVDCHWRGGACFFQSIPLAAGAALAGLGCLTDWSPLIEHPETASPAATDSGQARDLSRLRGHARLPYRSHGSELEDRRRDGPDEPGKWSATCALRCIAS